MKQTTQVKAFFDSVTNTFSYVVSDPDTQRCAVIDSVLDYDAASATTKTEQADLIITYIQQNSLSIDWILETHVHADHLSAAQYLKQKLGGKIAISHKIEIVQQIFGEIYHLDIKSLNATQSFDYLFADHETFLIGNIKAYNIPTPGHTPACLSYVVGDAVFVGDTLFMPDYGTARCDFPKGSAATLFDSVKTLYSLPDQMRMFLCHDYLPETRESYVCETTIQAQKTQNIHIHEGVSKTDSLVNMEAGQFPTP